MISLRLALVSLIISLLGACSILPDSPQLNHYELPAATLQPLGSTPAPYTLQLLTPYANRTLNTQRILVNPEGYELRAYQGAAWVDNTTSLLRDRLAQALLETQLVHAITFAGESGSPKLVLQIHLYRFQVHYDEGVPTVHIQLNAQLISRQTGKILAVQPVYVKQAIHDGVTLQEVVPAFGKAADEVSRNITQWLYQSLQNPEVIQGLH